MRNFYKLCLLFVLIALVANANAQKSPFSFEGQNVHKTTTGRKELHPTSFGLFSVDQQFLKAALWSLPAEKKLNKSRTNASIMRLPMPDGSTAAFRVWESSLMEPALAAKFPEMRQFLGQGIDDPYATIRFDYNPYTGFHAQILSPKTGRIFIDPYATGDKSNYISYFARDITSPERFVCNTETAELNYPSNNAPDFTEAACLGTTLRTYRLALACTGEYAVAVNGPAPTIPGVAAAMLTAVTRVTGVYENEVSVRLVLVANNSDIIYLDGSTDPYSNGSGLTMLGQNQANCDAVIGNDNYDIGHVFSTGGGGVAGLGVICNSANKGRGVTGLTNPTGDAFYIDFVAHEMGHQFGGNHTFNSITSNCSGGNRNASTAYEVGSGTSIQAYAGICGSDNIQPNSDPYFHAISFDEISNRINATSCAATSSTSNALPVIDPLPNNGVFIPVNTPFTLSGTATDANGDPLTYSWEQMDLGTGGAWNSAAASTTGPLFKMRVPKTTGVRTFPDMAVILAGFPANPAGTMGGLKGETLPTVARAMNFRLTVRDYRAGGGGTVSSGTTGCQSSTAFVVNTSGTTPFSVTSPNGGESYPGGSTQTITWDNAGTNAAPFNVSNVRITLSTDGGLTYPNVITNSTPNDGSEVITIPSVPATTTAKIKIEAIGNIFFDISNANFTITVAPNGYTFGAPTNGTSACPASGTIISTIPVNFSGTYTGPVTLSYVSGAPAGVTVVVSPGSIGVSGPATVTFGGSGLTTLTPGTYNVTIQGVGPAPGGTQTATVGFIINSGTGPVINSQPVNATVCAATAAPTSFSVAATGATGFQWQVNTGTGFTNIPTATAATYTIPGGTITSAMNGNQYRCVVTGQCGTTNSNAAILTVNTGVTITTQPTSLAVCSGSTATFTAAGTGSPAPGYQWQISTAAVPAFTNIPAATNASYTTPPTTIGMSGDQYRCVISNVCGTLTTDAAVLTVNSLVTITSNPTAQTICVGSDASFTVAAGGSGLSYQWQVSTDGGANYTNVAASAVYSGVNTPSLSLTAPLSTFNNYRYRCVITSGVCTPGISTGALLIVNTFPLITAQPVAVTICEGANISFSVTATSAVSALGYQWQISTNGGSSWNNIGGAMSNTYAQNAVPATQNGNRFRVLVSTVCGTIESNAVTLTVNTFPIVTVGSTPTSICKSDPSFTVSATPAGGTWSGAGLTGTTFSPSVAGVGQKTITYTATNAGCVTTQSRVIDVLECPERNVRLSETGSVLVYPNPSNGQFNIRLNSQLYTRLGVRIFGADGRLYKEQVFTGLGYRSIVPINISNLTSGAYMLFLYNDENGFDKRVDGIIINR